MLRLVRPFHRHADVVSLLLCQYRQLGIQFFQLQPGHLLIQMLGQYIDAGGVFTRVTEDLDLGDGLVGKRRGHDIAGVAGGATQVDQTAFGQQDDPVAGGEDDMIHLGLNLFPLVLLQGSDLDFVVKVADVADNGLILHLQHMLVGYDVVVAGAGHKDIGLVSSILHGHHAVAFHGSLQCADRVNLSHPNLGRQGAHGLGRALAHIAVAADQGYLTGHHDISGTLDAVHQGLAATVEVVKL